jgi:hypothetical protein
VLNFATSSQDIGDLHTTNHVHLNGTTNPISKAIAKGMVLFSCVLSWSLSRHIS